MQICFKGRYFLLLILLALNRPLLKAQNYGIMPGTPNPSALGKYVEQPVSYHTGKTGIDIPLWEIKLSDGFSLPVSLNYNAGGIKVDDQASSVGLGWSLMAGGMITRAVKGLPDDYDVSKFSYTELRNNRIRGFGRFWNKLENSSNASDLVGPFDVTSSNVQYLQDGLKKLGYTKLMSGIAMDPDPDVFYFNFGGFSGKFVFDIALGTPEVKTIPYQDLNVTWTLNERNNIVSFTIVDNKGNSYLFSDVEENWNIINTKSTPGFPVPKKDGQEGLDVWGQTPTVGESIMSYKSSWFLSKVTTATGQVIDFGYENEQIHTAIDMPTSEIKPMTDEFFEPAYVASRRGRLYTVTAKRLTSITSPGERLEFVAAIEREDIYKADLEFLPHGNHSCKAITGVNVYDTKNNQVKSYRFSYSYFESPWLNSFIHASDLYSPSTPSFTDYNTFFKRLKLDKVEEVASDGTLAKPYDFQYQTAYPLPHKLSYAQDLWGYYNGATSNLFPIPKMYIYPGLIGDDRFRVYPKTNYTLTNASSLDNVLDGVAGVTAPAADRLPNASYTDAGMLTKVTYPTGGYTEYTYEPHSFFYDGENYQGGGLRIKRISNYDGNNVFVPATSRRFSYTEKDQPGRSSGRAISIPMMGNLYQRTNNLQTNVCRSNVSQAPLGTTNGSAIGYKEVTEEQVDMNGTTLGKSIYKYDLPASHGELDDQNWYGMYEATPIYKVRRDQLTTVELQVFPRGSHPFAPGTDYDWNRGSLLSKTDYDANGAVVATKVNTWGFYYPASKNSANRVYGITISGFEAPAIEVINRTGITEYFVFGKYSYLTDIAKVLKSTRETEFTTVSDSVSKVVDYQYNGIFHTEPTRIDIKGSKGEINSSRYYFAETEMLIPGPYQSPAATVYNKRMTSIPLRERRYVDNVLTDDQQTVYHEPHFGVVVPEFIRKTSYKGSEYHTSVQNFHSYDNYGRLQSASINNSPKSSYLWASTGRDVIAEVKNAAFNDFAYADCDNTLGGWGRINPQTGIMDLPDVPFGKSAYILNGPSLVKGGLTPNKPYTISFYLKDGGGVIIRGANSQTYPIEYGPVKNGWKYGVCKTYVDPGTQVAIIGSGYIDELKIYPKESEMTTYTYKPLVGMVSQTDTRGMTTYYEYDNFRRLKCIKDQEGNIIKSYDYHYKP